jgi:uncharacterized membrane protein
MHLKKIKSYETCKRIFVKALTYRFYQSFLVSPIIIYALSQDLMLAFKFSILEILVLEILVKVPAYYLFERLWAVIKHGYKGGMLE